MLDEEFDSSSKKPVTFQTSLLLLYSTQCECYVASVLLKTLVSAKTNKSSAAAEIWATVATKHGPIKEGGGAVPLSRSAGNPSNTMWPALRSTSVPSGVFIHPAVWPQ